MDFSTAINMAEVLTLPQQDARSHFGAGHLHRSSSHSTLLLQSPSYSGSSPDLRTNYSQARCDPRHSTSLPSSAPSSPSPAQHDFSNQPSYLSTPSSSLSLDEPCSSRDEDLSFPTYDEDVGGYRSIRRQDEEPPPSPVEAIITEIPQAGAHTKVVVGPQRSLSIPSLADNGLPEPLNGAADDTTIQMQPTRHVDYLSHNWKEEDIWSSWRHIVGKRKSYSNSTRLENASWRTWAKAKYGLKTVSPETLNWYAMLVSLVVLSTENYQDEGSRCDMAVWTFANRAFEAIRSGCHPSHKSASVTKQLFWPEKADIEET